MKTLRSGNVARMGKKKCIQNFEAETPTETSIFRLVRRWEDLIKIDLWA
jgi:hypothetical protein